VEAGATTVTVCDTAGAMLPREFAAFFEGLYETVPALRGVTVGVACADALAMADACAVTAVLRGAREVKASAYPAGGVSLQSIARVLAAKGEGFGVRIGVRTVELKRGSAQIARLFESVKNTPYDGFGSDEGAGLVLSQHDGRDAVLQAVARLGYDLSEEDAAAVWEAFCRIAGRKDEIGARELDAIVASVAMQVPAAYEVRSYVINTGSGITAMAHIKLARDGREQEGVALGDGPIDAAFLALEQVTGRHCEMDDFQIRTVTEGHEAMGETVVRLRSNGKLYPGRGISTDIVGASIHAYVNALNKMVYEEGEA
jgi:2-isopropylmalate synthase